MKWKIVLGVLAWVIAIVGSTVGLALYFEWETPIMMIYLIAVFLISLIVTIAIINTACPNCNKKLSMREISRKLDYTRSTTVNVKQDIRNKKGEITGSYMQAVPATEYFYICIDECKHCGYQRTVRRSKKERD